MSNSMSLDTGLQFARKKQYDEAVKIFSSLLSQDQTHTDIYFYRGCAYIHLGQYKKSINDFSLVITSINFPSKYEILAIYKRGYSYYKLNQYDSALDDYRHYINQCKNNEKYKDDCHKGFFQMGVINAILNRNDIAIKNFTDAIDCSDGSEENNQKLYYLHRGRAYACIAKFNEAEKDLQRVVSESKHGFIRGCAYNELNDHENAEKEFINLKSNENQSNFVQTYQEHILFRLGLTYASRNFHDQAIKYFQSALNHPKQSNSSNITDRILFRKGMSNMEINHPHRALIDFNDSTKLNNNQSDVFYARGMLHYKLGRHDAAVYDQRKAIELDRNISSSAPIYNTIYQTNNYDDHYIYYEDKLHEAEELVKKNIDTPNEPIIYRDMARYLQKQAPYSTNPLESYQNARGYIEKSHQHSNESQITNSIANAFNSYCIADCLAKKYLTDEMPKGIIEQYIDRSVESILSISNLTDKCINNEDWCKLIQVLNNELAHANGQRVSHNDIMRMAYFNNQLEKIDMIRKSMELFADSPAQQEFYKRLVIRVCNLFDGVRMASTGIFAHQLEGTFTKVSWAFQLLGKLSEFVPIVSDWGKNLFGICESGFKKLDETRIQNGMNHLGRHLSPKTTNEIANDIVIELTIIYENQINRFMSTLEEDAADDNNNQEQQQQQQPTFCSKCANCFGRCWHCLQRRKDHLLNEMELSTMESIVEFAFSLALSCVIEFRSKTARKPERIKNLFVNGICRPSKQIPFHIMTLFDKIKPNDAKTDKDHWNTYDFFRRPAIDFENGIIRAQKETDMNKFGCRKATTEEKHWFKIEPEKIDGLGFKIIVKDNNSS